MAVIKTTEKPHKVHQQSRKAKEARQCKQDWKPKEGYTERFKVEAKAGYIVATEGLKLEAKAGYIYDTNHTHTPQL